MGKQRELVIQWYWLIIAAAWAFVAGLDLGARRRHWWHGMAREDASAIHEALRVLANYPGYDGRATELADDYWTNCVVARVADRRTL